MEWLFLVTIIILLIVVIVLQSYLYQQERETLYLLIKSNNIQEYAANRESKKTGDSESSSWLYHKIKEANRRKYEEADE